MHPHSFTIMWITVSIGEIIVAWRNAQPTNMFADFSSHIYIECFIIMWRTKRVLPECLQIHRTKAVFYQNTHLSIHQSHIFVCLCVNKSITKKWLTYEYSNKLTLKSTRAWITEKNVTFVTKLQKLIELQNVYCLLKY